MVLLRLALRLAPRVLACVGRRSAPFGGRVALLAWREDGRRRTRARTTPDRSIPC